MTEQGLRYLLSPRVRTWIGIMRRKYCLQWPPRGSVSFGDLRRVMPVSARFGMERGRVTSYGNVLSASAHLQGLALEELEYVDPDFEAIIGACIAKAVR